MLNNFPPGSVTTFFALKDHKHRYAWDDCESRRRYQYMVENDGSAEGEVVVDHWERQSWCGFPGAPMGSWQSDLHHN
jgi:hypothetical protein